MRANAKIENTIAPCRTTAVVPTGAPGMNMAIAVSRITTIASNARSTASDAKETANGMDGTSRVSAYAHAGSPVRNPTTLFTIIPMATDRHNGPKLTFWTGSRIARHLSARIGNINVAIAAERTRSE